MSLCFDWLLVGFGSHHFAVLLFTEHGQGQPLNQRNGLTPLFLLLICEQHLMNVRKSVKIR